MSDTECACNCYNAPNCVAYHFDYAADTCFVYKNLGDILHDAKSSAYIKNRVQCHPNEECTPYKLLRPIFV